MTTLKQINQLLESELTYLYGFPVTGIYYNSLESDNDSYESFYVSTMENVNYYFKHLAGWSFEVEKGSYAPKRFITLSETLFNGLRDITIKATLKKQIETYTTLLEDTKERIKELEESKFYYDTKKDEAKTLLRKLEVGENE